MKVKTSELKGSALDWAVGYVEEPDWSKSQVVNIPCLVTHKKYSTEWAQGGPIIEREKISLRSFDSCWQASIKSLVMDADKDAPLIAAMRCYVASKLGDEVDIPEELLND